VGATNALFGGNGVVNSNTPAGFVVYGLSGNTNIAIGADFKGCIYAPTTEVSISGIGTNEVTVTGSVVARRMSVTGHVQVHYDEALGRGGPFDVVGGSALACPVSWGFL
jgi:hypothetical protein